MNKEEDQLEMLKKFFSDNSYQDEASKHIPAAIVFNELRQGKEVPEVYIDKAIQICMEIESPWIAGEISKAAGREDQARKFYTDAYELARDRNDFFCASESAFKAGLYREAIEVSQKGKLHNRAIMIAGKTGLEEIAEESIKLVDDELLKGLRRAVAEIQKEEIAPDEAKMKEYESLWDFYQGYNNYWMNFLPSKSHFIRPAVKRFQVRFPDFYNALQDQAIKFSRNEIPELPNSGLYESYKLISRMVKKSDREVTKRKVDDWYLCR
ncbi:MAG: hypothetical protein KKF56_01750 [Nanoarchaeota archaeon]|nr:hypothetical protein [Nanoarchaeota archaeon]